MLSVEERERKRREREREREREGERTKIKSEGKSIAILISRTINFEKRDQSDCRAVLFVLVQTRAI